MTAKSQPLRTALIGLSSSAKTSWASAAHLPGLLSPAGRQKFQITALLNSSVDAAKSAIQTYKLPPTTKAYGTPQDLANDKDIDLVICNTRVDKHYETILPSVKAGKDVFVEWPIASNREHVAELVEEARKSGSRVAVGLQRRWAAPILKVKEIVNKGELGKVLSSEVRVYGGTNGRDVVPEGLKYFTEREVGGNVITIGFAHSFDTILSTLGELDPSTTHSTLQIRRPDVKVRDTTSNEIVETIKSDVPDILALNGTVKESGATLSFNFRRGQPFPGTPPLTWTIDFEEGELRFNSPSGTSLTTGPNGGVSIEVHHFDTDKVEEIPWDWKSSKDENGDELSETAKNVQRVLFAFGDDIAAGKKEGDGWLGVEDAAARAEQIWGFFDNWDKARA
ncbi:putative oxidoreductase [Lophiotrema nucula]|uniref:Putative oxidoreductase n=1 Tax=Lophiotrema nucula TaxID=690887 RepID=A0A6A5YFP9_9PLEO|nr:putative oxidoreductase [Lophiotrema nucula]